jgi:hypothetical protein
MELDFQSIFKELNKQEIDYLNLIKLKQKSGRKQDIADVEYLKMILER